MRPALSIVAALVLVTSALAARQRPPAAPTATVAILPGDSALTGRIVERTSERALAGVLVTLTTLDRKRALVTHTDANGGYEFTHIAAGDYRVSASHPEYATAEFDLKDGQFVLTPRAGVIELPPRVTKSGIDLSLARGGAIAGKVTREDGQPLKGAHVVAFLLAPDSGGFSIPANAGADSNDRGEYVISNLPEGRYRVTALWKEDAGKSGWATAQRTIYYPGATRVQEAATVPLAPGTTARDIDIVFPGSELLRISGRIIRSGSAGEIEALVMAERATPVTVASDGTFTTPILRAGRYTLVARSRSDDALEAALITVDLSFDLSDLIVGLMPTGVISGRVVTDDGTPVSDEMQVAAVLADQGKELDEYRRDRSEIGPRGEFLVRGVFGQRVMRIVGITAGWKIARVTVGRNEVTTLSVEPGATIDDVLIVITRS